jgi:hypothetical protein
VDRPVLSAVSGQRRSPRPSLGLLPALVGQQRYHHNTPDVPGRPRCGPREVVDRSPTDPPPVQHSQPFQGHLLRNGWYSWLGACTHMYARIDAAAELPVRGDPGPGAGDHL